MGGRTYLGLCSISMAILADIILYVFGYDECNSSSCVLGSKELGQAAGQWILWFFTDRFRQDWR